MFLQVPCGPWQAMLPFGKHSEQTGNGGQEGNPFDQRRGQDHVGTNVVCSFRLAGDAFDGALADQADTDARADGRETGADSTQAGLNYIQQSCHQHHNSGFLLRKIFGYTVNISFTWPSWSSWC